MEIHVDPLGRWVGENADDARALRLDGRDFDCHAIGTLDLHGAPASSREAGYRNHDISTGRILDHGVLSLEEQVPTRSSPHLVG